MGAENWFAFAGVSKSIEGMRDMGVRAPSDSGGQGRRPNCPQKLRNARMRGS